MGTRSERDLNQEIEDLAALIAELKENEVLARVERHIESGTPPAEIISACQEGMRLVGLLHEKGQYFIAGLIMAGEIMHEVVELLRPVMIKGPSGKNLGRVLLGTVAGDIHDIGKNLFRDLLECHGFTVLDLGVDVPPVEFVRAEEEFKPHLIAASALLTDSFPQLRELVALFEEREARPMIIIGGGQVDELVFNMAGSDYWSPDAFSGVRLCQKIVNERAGVK